MSANGAFIQPYSDTHQGISQIAFIARTEETTMIQRRPAAERGHANYGWLDTWHSFSFADYYDPAHMGWGSLRVINDDTVAPGRGFATHGHRDMEIVSVVLEGALAHKDSMGHGTTITPGEVQRMSAGTGVMHSEFNPSSGEAARFLQIWIMPNRKGGAPSYEQKRFDPAGRVGRFQTLASSDGRDGSVTIQQDATLSAVRLDRDAQATAALAPGRKAYLHVVSGGIAVNGVTLTAGDGARIDGEAALVLTGTGPDGALSEALLFDLTEPAL
jgi:redox-sensitive bicupin YhaK (pirin superfamily)